MYLPGFILLNITDVLKEWDQWLFVQLNTVWTSSFLDSIFPWWRDSNASMPVYLFLITFLLMNFGWRSFSWIIGIALTITVSDQLSSTVIKNVVGRIRPCMDPDMEGKVRMLLNHCSGGFSFPSSHATNHFAAAFFIFGTLRPYLKKRVNLFFVWAATISYGQVYVGVHYPIDILCGAVIGSLIGIMLSTTYNRLIGMPPLLTEREKKIEG